MKISPPGAETAALPFCYVSENPFFLNRGPHDTAQDMISSPHDDAIQQQSSGDAGIAKERTRNTIPDSVIEELYHDLSGTADRLVPRNTAVVSPEDVTMRAVEKLLYSPAAATVYENGGDLKPYAARILTNTFFALHNRETTGNITPYDDMELFETPADDSKGQLGVDELKGVLESALRESQHTSKDAARLQLEAIWLRHVEGLSPAEIAARQGTTNQAAKSRTHNALKKLRGSSILREYMGLDEAIAS